MVCSLEALPHPDGLKRAQELSNLIPQSLGISDQMVATNQLCIRLQMALLAGDDVKALRLIKDLGRIIMKISCGNHNIITYLYHRWH